MKTKETFHFIKAIIIIEYVNKYLSKQTLTIY